MYDSIRPYSDAEALSALSRVAAHPVLPRISAYLYPELGPDALRERISGVTGVRDFQERVMCPAVERIIERTTDGVSVGGLEHLRASLSQGPDGGRQGCLILSNHRDIVLDPAILQCVLNRAGLPLSDIAAGDNLIRDPFVRDLMRSNRMVTVRREGTPRELYAAAVELSSYIRDHVAGGGSLWIAQREGRTKDGRDVTAQGVLKMLAMARSGSFAERFAGLRIVPLSISYEFEPCGVLKARENLLRRAAGGTYRKAPDEDLNSILTGILQQKGHVHYEFGEALTEEEIAVCGEGEANARFRALASLLDGRIRGGYRIWPTNRAAAELLRGGASQPAFEAALQKETDTVSDVDPFALRAELLSIYAAPLLEQ